MATLASYSFLAPYFWSYDLAMLDTALHKQRIIKNVLNFGSVEAVAWLRQTYTDTEIQSVITSSIMSEWSPKSLTLWQHIFKVTPKQHRITV